MTIATCYLSVDGVVLRGRQHVNDVRRKRLGPNPEGAEHALRLRPKDLSKSTGESALGITMWGLGDFESAGLPDPRSPVRRRSRRNAANYAGRGGSPLERLFWKAYADRSRRAFCSRSRFWWVSGRATPDAESELRYYLRTLSGGFLRWRQSATRPTAAGF